MAVSPPIYRAVIFDIGGVVVGSPLHAIAAYERDLGIPVGFINRVVVTTAPHGGWSRLERGELRLDEFYPVFDGECAAAGHRISAEEMMLRISAATTPRPAMLDALRAIRRGGLQTAAITNNWVTEEDGSQALRPLFDVFIESAVVGVRKPDPRIFEMACRELQIAPAQAVFLDDIGLNLKSARTLGMTTIKVAEPLQALHELQALLPFSLGLQSAP